MKRVCAWCRKEMGTVYSRRPDSEKIITHGVCDNCRDNMLFQRGVDLAVFLDSLKLPIVMVNGEGIVVSGNNKARTLLQKELTEIEGYRGGEVFECAYARLPEGCGNTTHCSGCAIRRTVMETFGTGRSFQRVPATLNRDDPRNPETVQLLISTERVADYVLLRIDQMKEQDMAQPLTA